MAKKTRTLLVAGNWKMYKTIEEAQKFVHDLASKIADTESAIYLAVPFTALQAAAQAAVGSKIVIGAQNMNDATEGAFTGEIAGKMLSDAGARFVILGHSERRHLFDESSALICRKVKRALLDGLQPILCVGETRKEREEGHAQETVKQQLLESLEGVELDNILIAYEPVWAIGTGLTASPEEAEEMHAFCRSVLEEMAGKKKAGATLILYGGSVKPENAQDLCSQENIDGLLVGGASLSVDSFSQIIHNVVPQ